MRCLALIGITSSPLRPSPLPLGYQASRRIVQAEAHDIFPLRRIHFFVNGASSSVRPGGLRMEFVRHMLAPTAASARTRAAGGTPQPGLGHVGPLLKAHAECSLLGRTEYAPVARPQRGTAGRRQEALERSRSTARHCFRLRW